MKRCASKKAGVVQPDLDRMKITFTAEVKDRRQRRPSFLLN